MDHDVPARVAFCNIFFGANGGQFDSLGRPIRTVDEDIRGMCDQPYDCGQCPFMSQWLEIASQSGWEAGWWCSKCVKETVGKGRELKGFYQSGFDPEEPIAERAFPTAPLFNNENIDSTPLKGCTRCGWQSSFLQLVLWEGHNRDLLSVR